MRLRGRQLGSTIGAAGGLVFVLVNAGTLPGAVSMRVAAVLVFVVTMVAVRRDEGDDPPGAPGAMRTYVICVVAEVVSIPAGAAALRALDRQELVLPWVVFVLGVHFVPFARAFGAPLFLGLGLAEMGVAVVGAVVTLAGDGDDAPLWTAVAAGFVLLCFSLAGVAGRPVRAG